MPFYKLCRVNKSVDVRRYKLRRRDRSYIISNVFRYDRLYIDDFPGRYIVEELPFCYGKHRVISVWHNNMLAGIFLDSICPEYESVYLSLLEYSRKYANCQRISFYYMTYEKYMLLLLELEYEAEGGYTDRVVVSLLFYRGRIKENNKNKRPGSQFARYNLYEFFQYYLKKYIFNKVPDISKIMVYEDRDTKMDKLYGAIQSTWRHRVYYNIFYVHLYSEGMILTHRIPGIVQSVETKFINTSKVVTNTIDLVKPKNRMIYDIKMNLRDLEIRPLYYNVIVKFDQLLEVMRNGTEVVLSAYRVVLNGNSLSLVNICHQKIDNEFLAKTFFEQDFKPILIPNEQEKLLVNNASPYFVINLNSGKTDIYHEISVISLIYRPEENKNGDYTKKLVLVRDEYNNYKILCFLFNKIYWSISVPDQFAEQVLEIFQKGFPSSNKLLLVSPNDPALMVICSEKDTSSNKIIINVFYINKYEIKRIEHFEAPKYSIIHTYDGIVHLHSYGYSIILRNALYYKNRTSSDDYLITFIDVSANFRYDYLIKKQDSFWYFILNTLKLEVTHTDRFFIIYSRDYYASFNNRKIIVIDYTNPEKPEVHDGLMLYCDSSAFGLYIIQKNCFLIHRSYTDRKLAYIVKAPHYHIISKSKSFRESTAVTDIKIYEHLLENKRYRVTAHINVLQKLISVKINDVVLCKYSLPAIQKYE